jgi:hypothetical protein
MIQVGILYVDKFPVGEPSPNTEPLLRMEVLDPLDDIRYAYELTIDWKPFAERGGLRRDGVLMITLTTERGIRKKLVWRMWSRRNIEGHDWWGEDYYAVGTIDGKFFCRQWDESDLHARVRPIDDPHAPWEVWPEVTKLFPDRSEVDIFIGKYVPQELWDEALKIFEAELF